jgi:RNA polymerase sigma factor (sigma-70 family)
VDIPNTNNSLLLALQSQSPARREAAWASFEPSYRPVILAWCRRWHLPGTAPEDLTQEILLKLSVKFLRHCYDPAAGRFRGWLRATVRRALIDYGRAHKNRPDDGAVGGTDHHGMLANLASPEAADQLSEVIANQPVTRAARAIARVKARWPETHWKAFVLRHLEKVPGAAVAAEVGLEVWNVYKTADRIKKELEEELTHG